MADRSRRLHRDLDRRAHHRRRLGPGRDRRQPAHRVALPGGEDGQAEHAARVVARRPGHRRVDGCRHVGGRARLAGQALRRHPAGSRCRRAFRRRPLSAHRARGGRRFDGRDVPRAAQPAVPRPVLFDVPDGRDRARARAVGGLRAQPDGAHAGHPAARVRQRADVRHAPFRGAARAQALARRAAVGILPDGIARSRRARRRRLAAHGPARGDDLGHRRLLHVADDAGDGVGAVSERRRATDGIDGHGRDAVDPVRAADDGIDLRREEDRGGRRGSRVRALPPGPSSNACSASRRRRRFAPSRSCPRRCSSCSVRSGCSIAGAAGFGLRRSADCPRRNAASHRAPELHRPTSRRSA